MKLAVAAAMLLALATAAGAHPLPKAASPAPNAVLATTPAEIRVTFSEGLVAAFSGLELDDASGKVAETGPASVNPDNAKELIVPVVANLTAGTYTVKWHAVGTDTHHVAGHYSFQVKP